MTTIETDRLVLRNFEAGDWQDLLEVAVKYQASEYAKYDHKWPTDADEIKGVVEWFASGDRFLAVCLKSTGKVIGLVSLNDKGDGEYGFGYVFHTDYHRQGYATEACRAGLDRIFGPLGAEKVVTGTAEANEPSCRLLEKLGLKAIDRRTGSLQETEEGEPIEVVTLSFSITREEWAAQGA